MTRKNKVTETALPSPSNKTTDSSVIIGSKILLRNKKSADVWNDYTWEIDPELAQLDAASSVNVTFKQYLSNYTDYLRYTPSNRHQFAIDTLDGKHIGNCSYYNTNETKCETELGIMIGNRDYWDRGFGTDAVITLVRHIFHRTNIKRIYLKTLDSNSRAQKCFEKCGFTSYGHSTRNGFNFTLMELHRKQWQVSHVEA
ncbi:MAG: GNAT family N-acetyltransferase [Dehalococcoidales bacterium]|nr:GNAT family N-acetyltransferase [Dehalococcoidales bacterium]